MSAALELVPVADVGPLAAHPAAVYLARLAPGSRRTMARALDTIAAVLTAGACDRWSLPWARIRYPHAQAVRSTLGELMAWRSVNKHLSALRQVITEAWRLGLVDVEARARVVDVPNVSGDGLLAGRALTRGKSWRCSTRAATIASHVSACAMRRSLACSAAYPCYGTSGQTV